MDNRMRSFMTYSFLLILVAGAFTALFSYIYRFFTIAIYNKILVILIALSIIIMAAVMFAMFSIFYSLRSRRVNPAMVLPVRLGLKLVMPFALFVTDVFKRDKDILRSLFIDINNIFVQSADIRKSPDRVMLLLPHCLQNSECTNRITNGINQCRKCGRCCMGEILELVEETGVKAEVVTGGTAARNTIAREKPEIVLSVACERDLAIGISDVSSIPVLGVLNQRPNGPCKNTTVNVEDLREKLYSILSVQDEMQKGWA